MRRNKNHSPHRRRTRASLVHKQFTTIHTLRRTHSHRRRRSRSSVDRPLRSRGRHKTRLHHQLRNRSTQPLSRSLNRNLRSPQPLLSLRLGLMKPHVSGNQHPRGMKRVRTLLVGSPSVRRNCKPIPSRDVLLESLRSGDPSSAERNGGLSFQRLFQRVMHSVSYLKITRHTNHAGNGDPLREELVVHENVIRNQREVMLMQILTWVMTQQQNLPNVVLSLVISCY